MLIEDHARPDNSNLNVATSRRHSHPHIGGGNLINAHGTHVTPGIPMKEATLPHFPHTLPHFTSILIR